MAEVAFAVPGPLDSPTGGYVYARRLIEHLPRHDLAVRYLALPETYPHPSEADLAHTARLFLNTASDAVVLIDGLALGAMPPSLVAAVDRRIVALVHHPLGLEPGLTPERQAELIANEAQALAYAARVIVTSPLTGRLLAADYNVSADRIVVAEPGTDPAGRARGTGSPVELLAVGAVSPRKGFPVLVTALKGLADLDWHLTIAGSLDRDPAAAQVLRQAIVEAGLGARVTLGGALGGDALEDLYARADLFVSPSLYEGYGMALAEALAHGLPLIASTGGAAVETVPDAAALKVPPGNAPALAGALRRAITDPDLRLRLAEAAWAAGQELPRWPETASRIAGVLREVAR
jgi:glycosyltransferase involved in cell wall biosynthesis